MGKATESERLTEYTFRRHQEDGDVLDAHKLRTPPSFQETIDFLVVGQKSIHLIEVKETGSRKSIPPSQFEEAQINILTHAAISTTWVLCRFFSGDIHKNSHDYWETYALFPGYWIDGDRPLSLNVARDTHRCIAVHNGRDGWLSGYDESFGRKKNGTEAPGLTELWGMIYE